MPPPGCIAPKVAIPDDRRKTDCNDAPLAAILPMQGDGSTMSCSPLQFRSAPISRDTKSAGGSRAENLAYARLGLWAIVIAALAASCADRAKKGKQTRWIAQRSLIDNGGGEMSRPPRLLLTA